MDEGVKKELFELFIILCVNVIDVYMKDEGDEYLLLVKRVRVRMGKLFFEE